MGNIKYIALHIIILNLKNKKKINLMAFPLNIVRSFDKHKL